MDLDRVPQVTKYLSTTLLVLFLGRNMVWQFLPIYFEQTIDSVFLIGILVSLPPLVTLLMDIPTGNLVQRAGERIVLFLGLIMHVVPAALYLTALPVFLALGKVSEGVAKSWMWSAGWSLSMKRSAEENESLSLSLFLLGVHLAAILGPVIGGYLITGYGFSLVLWLWAGFGLLALPLYYSTVGIQSENGLLSSAEELLHRDTYENDIAHLREHWGHIKLPLLLIFVYSIVFSFFWIAVPLTLEDLGADFIPMGLIFGAAAFPAAFQFILAEWADRVGKLHTVIGTSALLVPILLLMGAADRIILVGILFLAARILMAGMQPCIHALFDHNAPEDVESELVGFLELIKHSGQTIGPFMAGTIASQYSMHTAFYGAGFITLLLLVASLYAERASRTGTFEKL